MNGILTMRASRSCLILLILQCTLSLKAQAPPLPSWMTNVLTKDQVKQLNTSNEVRATSVEQPSNFTPNQFIGSYAGTLTMVGESKRMLFTGWTDSTRGVINMRMSESVHFTYLADMTANVALLALSDGDERLAVIHHLNDLLKLNDLMKQRSPGITTTPLGQKLEFDGLACAEYIHVENGDTAHYCVSDIQASPFTDAWNWVPLHDKSPFLGLRFLILANTNMPLYMHGKGITVEISDVKVGLRPVPRIDLKGYELSDTRTSP